MPGIGVGTRGRVTTALAHLLVRLVFHGNPEWYRCNYNNALRVTAGKVEAQVNRPHLLTQPQQKLQLNYKTTITQNPQKIELHESLTTKELKKSHSSRWVGGKEMQRLGRGSPTPTCGG